VLVYLWTVFSFGHGERNAYHPDSKRRKVTVEETLTMLKELDRKEA
jgi:hypothetical protein